MHKTSSLVFCHSLPQTEASFDASLRDPGKDFIRHYIKDRKSKNVPYDWNAYYLQLVKPYSTMRETYKKYGVRFIDDCTWKMYQDVLLWTEKSVIIHLSHCIGNNTINEQIEFADKMVNSEELVQSLPVKDECVFDFAICNSQYLKKRSLSIRMKSAVGTSDKSIPISVWLYIYTETFNNMILKKNDFLTALDTVFRDAENRIKLKL